MRDSIYKSVDAVIFCFSLSDIQAKVDKSSQKKKGSSSYISLGNVKTIWLPEVNKALGREIPKINEE